MSVKQDITALTRPESIEKPVNITLKERGVKIVPADLQGPQDELVRLLSGIDVVISAIYFGSLEDEVPLANAAKIAGVKRFVQSAFMIVLPPRGVVDFREKVDTSLFSRTAQLDIKINIDHYYRKMTTLHTFKSFTFRTPTSMLAGGTNLRFPDSLRVSLITLSRRHKGIRLLVWMAMFPVL